MENEQYLQGDPQNIKSSGNEEGVGSPSKNKARRKKSTGIPKNRTNISCPVSIDPIDDEWIDGSFCFRGVLLSRKPTIVDGSLQYIEERQERLLPQRRQGRRNQSPSPKRRSTAK